jgi:hypothetical protein
MRTRLTILVTIALLINSCNLRHEEINDRIVIQENELLSQLFCDLIKPFPPPPRDTTKIGLKNYEMEIKRITDSIQYEVYLVDSLTMPDKSDFHNIELPIEFQELYNNFKNDTLTKSRKLKKETIIVKDNYKIITDFKIDSTYIEKIRHHNLIGIARFSRVSFNSDFTKACFFQSLSCGPESGGGLFVFAEKVDTQWKIVLRHLIWVS